MQLATAQRPLRCVASGGLHSRNPGGQPKQAPVWLPKCSGDKQKLLLLGPLSGLAASAQFGLLPREQQPAAVADPEACPKKLAQHTWDMLLAGLSILLVLTCCPLGLLFAALLSLSSLLLDALCQVVVTCQLDPLYTLFGPLTFGVMRWVRSGAVRHAVGNVHGTAKRFRRLARAVLRTLQQRGLQGLAPRPQ
ncbi:expressed protein [Chlorella variabilis]|uniref:Expressed protein n=1 Tax=Chlorella variabilis TaxID=554065 RepID=E1ZMC5_CHLVA|nr:expressed protein [Chlorella variabilis]EFN53085.1 expressed protein [Chlorella variabilis]|eukprot:XP_005845187.1 expressed protein [Chlorella variabilis]